MDLVPNHTSDQHAWFVDALSGRKSTYRDYYVWADPKPDGGLPNNWASIFGGPAWHFDEASGQYFLHNFEAAQPDLNWWNEEVRRQFDDIVRFWWDRGVAGFRIDVCNMMIKDKKFRDNPPATEDDPLDQQFMGRRAVYNTDRPEAHDILRRWRSIADTYEPERLLIGETNVEKMPLLDGVLRRRARRAARRLQLRLHRRAAGSRRAPFGGRGDRGDPARGCLAHLDGIEPRRVTPRHPLGGRRPHQGQARPRPAPDPPRHALPLSR